MPKKQNKPRVSDPFSREGILFFKVPLSFQTKHSSMTPSEISVFLVFMEQMSYKKSQWIPLSHAEIMYWSGISNKVTVTKALLGLVTIGWIGDIKYRKQNSNVYFINLEAKPNKKLLQMVLERSKKTSDAKKHSIQNGEQGKFKKK